ncbi:helix-turn-helix domain-containing protein [uncultured Tenacibaculum sp.]|uniref:helix-turn-helix domain-containing protein n=1 Tax=uncultured Tenacibaculum sp. TaxID=174713 RepID=UPI002623B787|nr:helix-turn-helix domain-containing protein [uncultured Tenacibaculum sp.]
MQKIIRMHDMSSEALMQMLKTLLKEEFKQLKLAEPDKFLTRKEAAEFLRISETKLWDLDRKQILPAKRLVGTVLYLKSDLLNFYKKAA